MKTKKVLLLWEKIDKDLKKELDLFADKRRLFLFSLVSLLEKGLGQRVSEIAVKYEPSNPWSVLNCPPKILWDAVIIGFKLNPVHSLSVIEKGPEANLIEVSLL